MNATSGRRAARALFACTGLLLGLAGESAGQLISPGKLASPHEALDGLRNCTQCHVLRERGVNPERCLSCHVPVKNRLDEGRGFHATLVEEDCGTCHKDHFGRDFALVRFDTLAFDHERAGMALRGSHERLECDGCHQAAFIRAEDVLTFEAKHSPRPATFLGLATGCTACHSLDDPHGSQFPQRACADCHGEETWEGADLFDHSSAKYRLDGRHTLLSCRACHQPLAADAGPGGLRFTGLAFGDCASCHDDPHDGRRSGSCAKCHGTEGWQRVDRSKFEAGFDHASTEFQLVGAHGRLACGDCHAPGDGSSLTIALSFAASTEGQAYPRPDAATCRSCHRDAHDGALNEGPTRGACRSCHTEEAWLPIEYDALRHDRDTAFELEGAHASVPCRGCHVAADAAARSFAFFPEASGCRSCHADDDPHRGQFGRRECTECHGVNGFEMEAFDHDATDLPLDATHRDLACTSCHVQESDAVGSFVRYAPIESRCRDCHGETA